MMRGSLDGEEDSSEGGGVREGWSIRLPQGVELFGIVWSLSESRASCGTSIVRYLPIDAAVVGWRGGAVRRAQTPRASKPRDVNVEVSLAA